MAELANDYGEGFAFKRVPMKEKTIKELSEQDIRVAVLGTVVNVNGDRLVMDDGSDSIEVLFPGETPKVSAGALVRVIGRVRSGEGDRHIEAEAIQDFKGVDLTLYKSLKKML